MATGRRGLENRNCKYADPPVAASCAKKWNYYNKDKNWYEDEDITVKCKCSYS